MRSKVNFKFYYPIFVILIILFATINCQQMLPPPGGNQQPSQQKSATKQIMQWEFFESVERIDFSPLGNYFSIQVSDEVQLFDKNFYLIRDFNGYLRGDINDYEFSPDEEYLALIDENSFDIIRMDKDRQIFDEEIVNAPFYHEETLNGIAFSPDGKYLARGDEKGDLIIWEILGNDEFREVQNIDGFFGKPNLSPAGNYMLFVDYEVVRFLERYEDFDEGYVESELLKTDFHVQRFAFSPDEKFLVFASDKVAILLNKPLGHFEETEALIELDKYSNDNDNQITCLSFSSEHIPENPYLAIGTYRNIHLYQYSYGKFQLIQNIRLDGWPRSVAFSPDNKYLAVADYENLKMYDLTSHEKPKKVAHQINHLDTVYDVKFSPDGQYFATISGKQGLVTVKMFEY